MTMTDRISKAIDHAEAVLAGQDVRRFSRQHETIVDYLQSKEFLSSKPEYQRRILKQAEFAPHWTLSEARGHSKPTGNIWSVFSERGKFQGQLKNRKEETKYAEYLNAMQNVLKGEDPDALDAWEKRWKGRTDVILRDNVKIKPVTDPDILRYLEDMNELPIGDETYIKA